MYRELSLPLPAQIAILGILLAGLFLLIETAPAAAPSSTTTATSTQVSASAASIDGSATSSPTSASSSVSTAPASSTTPRSVQEPAKAPEEAPASNPNEVRRIEHPYTTDPLKFETVNIMARSAVVNIFCSSNNGMMRPISGSGVFIDPKGIILTNAHVAQYVMLAESGRVNLQCQIRMGSPASAKWVPLLLYIPSTWIDEHAADLTKERPFGTGKDDFALLYAGASLDGAPRPAVFPYLAPDTREAIGFVDDAVLAASYPAEFLGSIASNFSMYPVTSITSIDELYTLERSTVDVVSIGSVMGAQSGSSGGAIVNAWGKLIAVITTTSDGSTTGERKLRGVTLSYINRDLSNQSGTSLSDMLSGNPSAKAAAFWAETAPTLVQKLLSQLK